MSHVLTWLQVQPLPSSVCIQLTIYLAVAHEVEQAIDYLKGLWFNPWLLHSACLQTHWSMNVCEVRQKALTQK